MLQQCISASVIAVTIIHNQTHGDNQIDMPLIFRTLGKLIVNFIVSDLCKIASIILTTKDNDVFMFLYCDIF